MPCSYGSDRRASEIDRLAQKRSADPLNSAEIACNGDLSYLAIWAVNITDALMNNSARTLHEERQTCASCARHVRYIT